MLLDASTTLKVVTIYNEGVDDLPLLFQQLEEVKIRELVDSHFLLITTGTSQVLAKLLFWFFRRRF